MRKELVRRAALFTLCLLPIAAAGGYLATQMLMNSLDADMAAQVVSQAGSLAAVLWVSAAAAAVYALVCGFFGYILADKIGLMRPMRLEKRIVLRVIGVSVIGGAVFSLDRWTFGQWIPEVGASYAEGMGFDAGNWFAAILYGGVIEEVMMRLFFMSLLALLGWKLFCRQAPQPPVRVLVIANVLAALLFAAGHLPATQLTFGQITPMLLLRCFLLNGAFGLIFGRFYRKYGIQYAMLAHVLFHLVSKTIWLIAA